MPIPPFGSAPFKLPSQGGNSGKYLTTNGTSPSWGTVAAGGSQADAASYLFSTTTTASDPSAGNLRFNNATMSSVTAVYISVTGTSSTDYTQAITRLQIGDTLDIIDTTSGTKWLRAEITAITNNTTWFNFTVTYIASGSGGLPSNADALTVLFSYSSNMGVIWYGTGTPASTTGNNGDFYFQQNDGAEGVNSGIFYGPKKAGAWQTSGFLLSRIQNGQNTLANGLLNGGSIIYTPTSFAVTGYSAFTPLTTDGWQSVGANWTNDGSNAYTYPASTSVALITAGIAKTSGGLSHQPVGQFSMAKAQIVTLPSPAISATISTTSRETKVISTVTRSSNVSTATTSTNHNLTTGEFINITGVTDTTFNASATPVTVTGATTFTYANTGTNGTDSSGTGKTNRSIITTSGSHGMTSGQRCTISGVTDSTFNATNVNIFVLSGTTFSYANTGTAGTSSSGAANVARGYIGVGSAGSQPYYACCDSDGKLYLVGTPYGGTAAWASPMASAAAAVAAGDTIVYKKEGFLFTVLSLSGSTGAIKATLNAVVGGPNDQGGSDYFANGSAGYVQYNDVVGRINYGMGIT